MRLPRTAYLFAAIFALVLSVTMIHPPRLEALPECGSRYDYYDSTYTFNVGSYHYDCSGTLDQSWGTATGWYTVYQNLWCCEA